ncbi:MAG: lipoate--protein ligase family protein [Candidatus Hodarchaeales archaeon]|jgi:lipoate-protein ligase A
MNISDEWDFVSLGPIDSVFTQSLWHAAALLRSEGELERNILSINWPTYPIVSCGFHQIVDQVVDLDYCKNNDILVIRRAVGGGAVYLDSNQLFYHFIWHNDTPNIPRRVKDIYQTLLEPVVQTYRDFGINAEYKPINDILANNRKISGNGAGMFDSAQVLVGNFILDFPRKEMSQILRVPDEKFRDKVYKTLQEGISSFKDELGDIPSREDIVSSFRDHLEESLGISLIDNELHPKIVEKMKELKEKYLTDEWRFEVDNRGKKLIDSIKIHGSLYIAQGLYKSQGGLIKAICEFNQSIIQDILIGGDFVIVPAKIPELENALKGINLNESDLAIVIKNFLTEEKCETPGTSAEDIAQAILLAYESQSR